MTNTFTDPRDGQTYKTVKIGNQIWLAENLKYKGPTKRFNNWTVEEKDFYFAPNGDKSNIKEYGCLYTWNNALKACPDGWHLPTETEIKSLLTYVGSYVCSTKSRNLRVTTWRNGADKYGFGALPSGYSAGGNYDYFGNTTYFWSDTESKLHNNCAYCLYVSNDDATIFGHLPKHIAFSVRCIKD